LGSRLLPRRLRGPRHGRCSSTSLGRRLGSEHQQDRSRYSYSSYNSQHRNRPGHVSFRVPIRDKFCSRIVCTRLDVRHGSRRCELTERVSVTKGELASRRA